VVRRLERQKSAADAVTNGGGDDYAVARAAIERLTDQFASGLVAASFWYVLLGLPGLAGYLAVNRLAVRLNVRDSGLAAFGFAASVLVPGANPASAYRIMLRDFPNAHSRAMSFAFAALASAFAIDLSGPAPGQVGRRGWVGDGNWRARPTSADVRRALYIRGVVYLLHMALAALLAMATFAL
jgi:adenosylcobinamide-phosphate synthase